DFFTNARGRQIRYGYVFPKGAKALICINVGLSEFCEKYFEVINDLISKEYAVSIHDWMGQGMSDRYLANPHKRHIGTYQDDVDDYFNLMDNHIIPRAREHYGKDLPRFMLGHSMGGHIGLHSLLRRPDIVKGAFFSAPLTRVRAIARFPNIVAIPLLKTLNTYYHRQYIPGGKNWAPRTPYGKTIYTHDPVRDEVFDLWCQDNPALKIGAPTIGWVHETSLSCKALKSADTSKLKLPLHAVLGGKDLLVDNRSTINFLEKIPSASFTKEKNAYHELMMETDDIRNRFFDAFDQFVAGILVSGILKDK
ncbi:MAG: alpha/beta fold hydrolase, partial [Bdellovibrionales bacterium]